MVAGAALLVASSIGLLLAMTADLPTSLVSRAWSARPVAVADPEARTASITLERARDRCRQMTFNNDTGQLVEVNRSCEKDNVRLDDKGVPMPMGTVHRLDAISKSFSKQ